MYQRDNGNQPKPAKLSKPKKIGFYSTGPQGNYQNDFSQLKYILKSTYDRDVNFDLNHNIGIVKKRISRDTNKKPLQLFLKDHRESLDVLDPSEISLNDVPFVASQGFFRGVTGFQYERGRNSFRVTAYLFRGVLYLFRLWPTEDWHDDRNEASRYRGYRFKHCMLSDDPMRESDIETPVDETSHFSCVFEAYLNKHRLIYAAQMCGLLVEGSGLKEGFHPHTHTNEQVLEEIRNMQFAKINTINEKFYRNDKALTWWLQATYCGIETILCGPWDGSGIVHRVRQCKTEDLLEENENFEKSNLCMDYCDRFLTFVKQSFAEKIDKKGSGSVNDVRNIPIDHLVFELLPGFPGFELSEQMPNEDVEILRPDFKEMFPKD